MNESPVPEEIADRATTWFVRLRAPDFSEPEKQIFFHWLGERCIHEKAFVDVLKLWNGLSVVKQMDFCDLEAFPRLRELSTVS